MSNSEQIVEVPTSLVEHLFYLSKETEHRHLPALLLENYSISYQELYQLAYLLSRLLVKKGLQADDRLWIEFPNSAEHIISVLAAGLADATAFQIAHGFKNAQKKNIQNRIQPQFHLGPVDTKIDNDIELIDFTIDGEEKSLLFSNNEIISLSDYSAETEIIRPGGEKPAFIKLSSGSTGIPKGVVSSHKQQFLLSKLLAKVFKFNLDHRELIISPIAHSGGWQRVAATLTIGGAVAFASQPLSINGLFEDIEEYAISGFFTTPPIARMLIAYDENQAQRGLSRCRSIELGSAPLSGDELKALLIRIPNSHLFFHYGLTECSRAFILEASLKQNKLHTVGKPAPGVKVQIRDKSNKCLAVNQRGEIFLSAAHLCKEYWRDPELSAARFVDNWFGTDDFGELDEDGFLIYHGRQDDIINCGGFSFFPTEVEKPLGTVEGIEQLLIAGIDDPRGIMGQVPVAIVVPIDAKNWKSSDLLKIAKKRLPAHMIPRKIIQVKKLILTKSGKPDRKKTVQVYLKNLD